MRKLRTSTDSVALAAGDDLIEGDFEIRIVIHGVLYGDCMHDVVAIVTGTELGTFPIITSSNRRPCKVP